MDNLSGALAGHQARDAFTLRCQMAAPWAIEIADRAVVALVVMLRGACILQPADADPVSLGSGDVAIIKGPNAYRLGDQLGTPISVVVEPGQVCRAIGDGPSAMRPGRNGWGNSEDGDCAFLAVAYELPGQIRGQLLTAVPDVIVVPAGLAGPTSDALVALLMDELASAQPGQDVVVDRMVDLVLVQALRQWFSRPESNPPNWWTAQDDRIVGPALALMHAAPQQPWNIELLAAGAHCSRATLARRFAEQLGQPPIAYLTQWRLELAADALRGTDRTVESVAHSVGYRNAFAFSNAFKRAYGCSPRTFRKAA